MADRVQQQEDKMSENEEKIALARANAVVETGNQPFRACKECRWAVRFGDGYGMGWWTCEHPRSPRDPVTGGYFNSCDSTRKKDGFCGPAAQYWEQKTPRPPEQPHRSLMERLFG